MTLYCPFCNNILIKTNTFLWLSCENHPPINLSVTTYTKNILMWDKTINSNYSDYLMIIKQNTMNLYYKYSGAHSLLKELPIDTSLTPENFIQKLKTYLLFL